jgi:hypothetical protein
MYHSSYPSNQENQETLTATTASQGLITETDSSVVSIWKGL